jgi:hypothetical protein
MIIIQTTNPKLAREINLIEYGRYQKGKLVQSPKTDLFEKINLNLGNKKGKFTRRTGVIKVMKNNALVLSYIAKWMKKYPQEQIIVVIGERIRFHKLPKSIKKASEYKGVTQKGFLNFLGKTKEELEKQGLDFELKTDEEGLKLK